MAEHDAKTPAEVGTIGISAPAQSTSFVAVVHMLGGQVLIGSLTVNNVVDRPVIMKHPYEVFAIPNKEDTKTQITLVKYGTMLGCMPELGVDVFYPRDGQIVKFMQAPEKLLRAYYAALQQALNPVTKEQVAAAITPGKAQP